MNIYSSTDDAIILYTGIWLVTAVCLYLNTGGLPQGPGKTFLGSWKVPKSTGIFCNQERANAERYLHAD